MIVFDYTINYEDYKRLVTRKLKSILDKEKYNIKPPRIRNLL